jgi:hypothetical protein
MDTDDATPVPEPPTIHEATRASGPSGAVTRGAEIDEAIAIVRRKAGLDVVVCGKDIDANRAVAQAIETAVGPWKLQRFHKRAGPLALPHFQQVKPPPHGHCFYETDRRKAGQRP